MLQVLQHILGIKIHVRLEDRRDDVLERGLLDRRLGSVLAEGPLLLLETLALVGVLLGGTRITNITRAALPVLFPNGLRRRGPTASATDTTDTTGPRRLQTRRLRLAFGKPIDLVLLVLLFLRLRAGMA